MGVGHLVVVEHFGAEQGVDGGVQRLVAGHGLDPAVFGAAVGAHGAAHFAGEAFEPFGRQVFAEVHVAWAGLGDFEAAKEQVFGGVGAHQPELDAVAQNAAPVVDILVAGAAFDGFAVLAVALDGEVFVPVVHSAEGVGLVGVVAAGVDGGCGDLHWSAVPVGEWGLQVGVQAVFPFALVGGVAVDDLVVNRPHFAAAADGPDGDFPALVLHVHTGHQLQAAHGHAAQRVVFGAQHEGVGVGFFDFFFPGFAQRFVDEAFQRRFVAGFFGGHALQELAHDGGPGGLRAVGRPDMHGHVARRAQQAHAGAVGPVVVVAPIGAGAARVVAAVVAAVADPHALIPDGQVVGLGDSAAAVGAVVAHGAFGVFAVPLEAVGDVAATPHERVLHPAVRAGDAVVEAGLGGVFALFDMAQALDAGRGAAEDFGMGGAFQPFVGQGEGVGAFFDLEVEGVEFVELGALQGHAPVVAGAFAALQVQDRAQELFHVHGVALALGHELGQHAAHDANVAQHGVQLGLAEFVAVVVGGLPQALTAALVLGVEGDAGEQHLGISHARTLAHVHLFNVVVAHHGQDGALGRVRHPALLGLAGFGRQVEVPLGPFVEVERLGRLERLQPFGHRCAQRGPQAGLQVLPDGGKGFGGEVAGGHGYLALTTKPRPLFCSATMLAAPYATKAIGAPLLNGARRPST